MLRSELSTGSTAELPETAETVLLAILLVATGALDYSGGFRGVSRFPRKPPFEKNDYVTTKCFNYCGVRIDRDTLIEQPQ